MRCDGPIVAVMVAIALVGGCGKQSKVRPSQPISASKAVQTRADPNLKAIEDRIVLASLGPAGDWVPKEWKDHLVRDGYDLNSGKGRLKVEVQGVNADGLIIDGKTGTLTVFSDQNKWFRVRLYDHGKITPPDIEYENASLMLRGPKLSIQEGALARVNGVVYRYSKGEWRKRNPT